MTKDSDMDRRRFLEACATGAAVPGVFSMRGGSARAAVGAEPPAGPAGLYETGRAPWKYYSEYYPKGTRLAMLVVDSSHMYGDGGAVAPTFAWMAEQAGYAFDVYWAEFDDPRWNKWPYFGCRALEQLLLVNSYFDVLWCTLGRHAAAMLEPIGAMAETLHFDDYLDLYEVLLKRWEITAREAVYVPHQHAYDQPLEMNREAIPHSRTAYGVMGEIADWDRAETKQYPIWYGSATYPSRERAIWNDPAGKAPGFYGRLNFYLWPDIYFSRKLAFTDRTPVALASDRFHLKQLDLLHTEPAEIPAALPTRVVDRTGPDDRAWALTSRVFERWQSEARGIAYGIHQGHSFDPHYLGWLIRSRYFAVYDPYWIAHMPKAAALAKRLGNRHMVSAGDEWDHFLWPYCLLLGVGRLDVPAVARIPSIKRAMRLSYSEPERAPWESELSDDELHHNMDQNRIAVCYTFGTNELGYSESLPALFEHIRAMRLKIGLGYYLPHIEYCPEWYHKLFTGYLAPHIEPMMHYWGVSALFPNDSIIHEFTVDDFRVEMETARSEWVRRMGEAYLPIGYLGGQLEYFAYGSEWDGGGYAYPTTWTVKRTGATVDWRDFVDWDGYQRHLKEREQARRAKIQAVQALGYRYYIGERRNAFSGEFVHVGAQGFHAARPAVESLPWKAGPGFFAVKHDLGLTYCPGYQAFAAVHVDRLSPAYHWAKQLDTLKWFADGGPDGRFFLVKPNELVRYLRILNAHGKFDDCYEYYMPRIGRDTFINPDGAPF
ncbi:MAG: hypothetical protein JXR94_00065 [Candidatus Hydrogenedentes bacterium]|nr:hypothetical protein [Candidatus Hydrogenedentota bacterium]